METGALDPRDTKAGRLAKRFARMVTLRLTRRIPLREASNTRRRGRPVSRNCALRRRQEARFTAVEARLEPEDDMLHASIRSLQSNIAMLERSIMLRDSARLLWRTNSSVVALDLTREYFLQFSHGYKSTGGERSASTYRFVTNIFRPDVFCRDFQGLQYFMDQWEKYTIFHHRLEVKLHSMRPVENDKDGDYSVSVHANADMNFTFTQDSFKYLYPSLFARSLRNSKEHEIVHTLIGSRACLSLELVLHFDDQGCIFAFEARVDIMTTLLQLLRSPSAAIYVRKTSIMTEDGSLQVTQNLEEVTRREKMLPTQFL